MEQKMSIGRILSVLLLGAFISILNQTLLNVAIPHLMNDFNVSATTVQWLSTGYMLTNGILIPITAFMIESFGTRALFISAMGLFTAGSVVCAVSTGFAPMLVGRIIQASGAGIIMPVVMNVFLTVFPPEKRGGSHGNDGHRDDVCPSDRTHFIRLDSGALQLAAAIFTSHSAGDH